MQVFAIMPSNSSELVGLTVAKALSVATKFASDISHLISITYGLSVASVASVAFASD